MNRAEGTVRRAPEASRVPELAETGRRMRGVTAGALVFAGVAAANLASAAFNLVAGRWLGPGRYGDLAALLAVLALVSFPLGAAQYNIAAWVAGFAARRDAAAVAYLARRSFVVTTAVGVVVALVLLILSLPIKRVLGVHDIVAVMLLAAAAIPAATTPAVLGLAQGLEQFTLFAWAQAIGPAVRFALLPVALAAGLGVGGAMGATLVGTSVTVFVAGFVLRPWFRSEVDGGERVQRKAAVRAIGPVTLGIVALTSLTTIDVVVAKLSFSSSAAGVYGGASLIARLILYVPAAIATVLLPKVSSRSASGRESADIIVKSLGATGILCLAATLVYGVAATPLVRVAYGSKYASAGSFLWLFGLAMTGFALVNIVFVYHVARNTTLIPFLMTGAAVVQLAFFAVIHHTPRELLAVSNLVAYTLLGVMLVITRQMTGRTLVSLRRPG